MYLYFIREWNHCAATGCSLTFKHSEPENKRDNEIITVRVAWRSGKPSSPEPRYNIHPTFKDIIPPSHHSHQSSADQQPMLRQQSNSRQMQIETPSSAMQADIPVTNELFPVQIMATLVGLAGIYRIRTNLFGFRFTFHEKQKLSKNTTGGEILTTHWLLIYLTNS